MTDEELELEPEVGRRAAVELVAHLKRMRATEVQYPVEGEAGTWIVARGPFATRRVSGWSVPGQSVDDGTGAPTPRIWNTDASGLLPAGA